MRLLLPLLFLVLTGCTATSMRGPYDADKNAQLLQLSEWGFTGRIAINVEDDPQASGQASISWQQAQATSMIRLTGPLGAGGWELSWSPEQVSANSANGEQSIRYSGPEAAEQFMLEQLGWAFPAESLRYWVRGYADPAYASELLPVDPDTGEDVDGVMQYGWQVRFERYQETAGYRVPARLTVQGHGVNLRMIISRWNLPADTG